VVVTSESVEGGGELASPFSSVLRFLEKSIGKLGIWSERDEEVRSN
jgi:hypothetical protein